MYSSFYKAMEQLKAFDIAIFQARKSSSQILLIMPNEMGQLLLKRASQLLAKTEDFNGNLCSADTLSSIYGHDIIINNGSSIRHISAPEPLHSNQYSAIFFKPQTTEMALEAVTMTTTLDNNGQIHMLSLDFFSVAQRYR